MTTSDTGNSTDGAPTDGIAPDVRALGTELRHSPARRFARSLQDPSLRDLHS